ncbi:MAG: LacI family DNA-binding transcriptional regulator [Sphaerochaetaceae bacterium]
MSNNITQEDVAKLAKVSTGTVSRVLNNHPLVSEKARDAVTAAIEQLGYIPNRAAQLLAQGKSCNILIAFIDESQILPSTWQYELPILQAINDFFYPNNYSIQLSMHTTEKDLDDTLFREIIRNKSIDGLIILTSLKLEKSFIESLRESRLPVVFVGNGPYSLKKENIGATVLFDNYQIIKDSFLFLHSLGHRRIGFITGLEKHIHSQMRMKAFTEIYKDYVELESIQPLIYHGDYSIGSGFDALYYFLTRTEPPTAIICANDLMAIGALKASHELRINVPQDLSIIGFDDIEVASYYSPPLSSIKVPAYDLGLQSARTLLNIIRQEEYKELVVLPTELVVRQSVGKNNGIRINNQKGNP